MEIRDLKAELSIKAIEFEQALNNGLSHTHLIKIYRELKELQYKIAVGKAESRRASYDEVIE